MRRTTPLRLLDLSSSLIASIAVIAGCGGKAGTRGGDADGSAAGGTQSGGTTGAGTDPSRLMPQTDAPPPDGDGRLVDISDQLQGFGWDTCGGEPRLSTTRTRPCPECSPATRGEHFAIIEPAGANVNRDVPQFYFFLDAPAQDEALWFDAMWINGPADSALSIVLTDQVCEPQGAARVFQLRELFSNVGEWVTACVPLSYPDPFLNLGFRVDAQGTLGLDAFRFGPACPAP
jgi:hypothetical protein